MKTLQLLLFFASFALAQAVEPIWLSPTNTNYDSAADYEQQFPPRGEWTNITVGAGARGGTPILLMDSKGTQWIMFGRRTINGGSYVLTVWNYNPKTDLYRWVAGPGNETTYMRDPGVLRVPNENNFPGGIASSTATIDRNDNIWLASFEECCELWMFNTTSYLFTRIQGDYSDGSSTDPNYGTVPGLPSSEVSPGYIDSACFVTDSENNLWLVSGSGRSSLTNNVWHFNTQSYLWTFISGNSTYQTTYDSTPHFGGRQLAGCDIDETDRIWIYGGLGNYAGSTAYFSDLWSFNAHTREWTIEYGDTNNVGNGATNASRDFHPDNRPPAKQSPALVNRSDGTLILVGGGGLNSLTALGGQNDVWLFNKTSKLWKLVYGEPEKLNQDGVFSHYRTPGSVMSGRMSVGRINGLNINGDVYIIGGETYRELAYKELWLVPYDQCSNNAHKCSVNAQCIEEMIGYSCACNQGYIGDGFTCTVAPPTSSPSGSGTPSSTTPSRVSSAVKHVTLSLASIVMAMQIAL